MLTPNLKFRLGVSLFYPMYQFGQITHFTRVFGLGQKMMMNCHLLTVWPAAYGKKKCILGKMEARISHMHCT